MAAWTIFYCKLVFIFNQKPFRAAVAYKLSHITNAYTKCPGNWTIIKLLMRKVKMLVARVTKHEKLLLQMSSMLSSFPPCWTDRLIFKTSARSQCHLHVLFHIWKIHCRAGAMVFEAPQSLTWGPVFNLVPLCWGMKIGGGNDERVPQGWSPRRAAPDRVRVWEGMLPSQL